MSFTVFVPASMGADPCRPPSHIQLCDATGVNHVIAGITDASLVKAFTGQTVEGVAIVDQQLRLLADEVVPNFR
jgi:5,10-methylenetetrahydromethanopterin reductase